MKRILIVSSTFFFLGSLLLAYSVGRAKASGTPQQAGLNYSGTLLNFGQADNGVHDIGLKLWSGGSLGCTTAATGVQLTNGRFTVPLDPSCVTLVQSTTDVQVEVLVDGTSMGTTSLGAVPYAITASNAAPGSALAQLIPPGTVIAYAGTLDENTPAPPGWLWCNGQAVSRTTYGALFSIIGTTHGSGDGSATFNLPDYRGFFLRGVDSTAGRDPDTAGRTAMASGGNTGNSVGSVQGSVFGSHGHGVNDPGHNHGGSTTNINNAGGATNAMRDYAGTSGSGIKHFQYGFHTLASGSFNEHTHGIPWGGTGIWLSGSGGNETRPTNAYVNYLIKL